MESDSLPACGEGAERSEAGGDMGYVNGVNLLPSTGEFTYDTIAYLGQRVGETQVSSINRYASGGPLAATGSTTDYTIALDQLQSELPDCTTVAVVVAWFGNATDVTACQIYPSTTYIGGTFAASRGRHRSWRCSGLTQHSSGSHCDPEEWRAVSSMAERRPINRSCAAFRI